MNINPEIKAFAANAMVLVDLLESKGFSRHQVLHTTRLRDSDLADPRNLISYQQYCLLIARAVQLTTSRSTAMEYGARLTFTGQNRLSVGALAVPSFLECLRFWQAAANVIEPGFDLQIDEEPDCISLTFVQILPVTKILPFKIDSFTSLLLNSAVFFRTDIRPRIKCCFTYDAAGQEELYQQQFRSMLMFGSSSNRILFPKDFCNQVQPFQNPVAVSQAKELLRELRQQLNRSENEYVRLTRNLLLRSPENMPTQDEVADQLHLSPRTLKRRLHKAGVTYRGLMDEIRSQLARDFLLNGNETIAAVSQRLGYQDAANFTHAFRRWTGRSPRDYLRNRPVSDIRGRSSS